MCLALDDSFEHFKKFEDRIHEFCESLLESRVEEFNDVTALKPRQPVLAFCSRSKQWRRAVVNAISR